MILDHGVLVANPTALCFWKITSSRLHSLQSLVMTPYCLDQSLHWNHHLLALVLLFVDMLNECYQVPSMMVFYSVRFVSAFCHQNWELLGEKTSFICILNFLFTCLISRYRHYYFPLSSCHLDIYPSAHLVSTHFSYSAHKVSCDDGECSSAFVACVGLNLARRSN